MSLTADLIKFINDSLKETSFSAPRFSGSEFYGIATAVPRVDENGVDTVVTLINEKGETVKDNLMFEKNGAPLQIYHRLSSSNYTPDPKESWGNDEGNKRTIQLSMLIFYKRESIQLSPEDMDLVIYSGLPSSVDRTNLPTGVESCSIIPNGCDFNQTNLLNREFKLNNYTLEPEAVLFEFKYSLECKYSKNCIQILCCP